MQPLSQIRRSVRSKNVQHVELLREVHDALRHAVECWEEPDSPEAFAYAMKHLMNLRNQLAALLENNCRVR